MIDKKCLKEISDNQNPGVEYEIALFYILYKTCKHNVESLKKAINKRKDCKKIFSIIDFSSPRQILEKLTERGLKLKDVSFETQNDEVGPADIVMTVEECDDSTSRIGLSVKYSNSCTLNVTGRRFLTENQISTLKSKLGQFTQSYINEMNCKYGDVSNWFRKRKPSKNTDKYIDLIRDAIIENWTNIDDKSELMAALYHSDSPIEYWVIKYSKNKYTVNTNPAFIDISRVEEIELRKLKTSYIAFYLDDTMIGRMQVKFNNGFVEKCKKQLPDIIEQGVAMSFGNPFTSWNFSVEDSAI